MRDSLYVSDHAVLRYLERVVGIDVDALRAEIAATCARSQGAPIVRVEEVRYLIRGARVVTIISGGRMPRFDLIARNARHNAGLGEKGT